MEQKLTNKPRREDFAIEEFCRKLSKAENCNVHIVCRPDNRGKTGEAKCDAIINRGGDEFTLEHTSLMTYGSQEGKKTKKEHEVLIERYIIPLNIEETIKAFYPDYWIFIHMPASAFDMKFDYETTFRQLKEKLIVAVRETPESRYGMERKEFNFSGIPFPVSISRENCKDALCVIIYTAPVNQQEVHNNLEEEISRAIQDKRSKLKRAKDEGSKTILLLDSDDISFVEPYALANAFGNIAPHTNMDGIDEVFVLYATHGASCIAPVKSEDRLYPNIPEFKEYLMRQFK